jgi:hypothetical protein
MLAQEAKTNAARAEAEAARPGEGWFYVALRLALRPFPHSFLCLSRAFGRNGGGGGTPPMRSACFSSCCGFDRARRRPAKIIKGTKKATCYKR